ncbi:MAG: hypothetical protein KAG56_02390 [Sulfurovaceae bacterium]|nr:hypothetical protein [Sulfurovaceae bacterium]
MKKLLFSILFIVSIANANPNVIGEYENKDGSIIKIEKSASEYKIMGFNADTTRWKGIGFYSSSEQCIKSVFTYISDTKFKDLIGYHKIEVKNNGKILLVYGGWDDNNKNAPADTFWKK